MTKLEDAISKGMELGKDIYRGVLQTRRGLQIRVTRSGLAAARRLINPNDEKSQGREEVRGDTTWTISGMPRNVTRTTLMNTLDNLKWKVIVSRSVPDNFDRQKLFWYVTADTEPEQKQYNIQFTNGGQTYPIIINKHKAEQVAEKKDSERGGANKF